MPDMGCGAARILLEDGSGFLLLEEINDYLLFEWETIDELSADGSYRVWNPDNKEPCRGTWRRPYAVWNPR